MKIFFSLLLLMGVCFISDAAEVLDKSNIITDRGNVIEVIPRLKGSVMKSADGKSNEINPQLKLLLITGFCGGFTTFSTFAAENVQLLENGNYGLLLGNVVGSVLIGMGGVIVGMKMI